MQFELFEKLRSSNKFQIELERSYYFLIIYMKKITFLALFECFLQSARLTCTV